VALPAAPPHFMLPLQVFTAEATTQPAVVVLQVT
jgi:hypothetical protein